METAVLFGNCGVLDRNIADCSIILPTLALRDEGTSFHDAPPSEEIEVNPRYRELFLNVLAERGVPCTMGKTWTTDAFHRETPEKAKRRREQGCVCVEMEASAGRKRSSSFMRGTAWTAMAGTGAACPAMQGLTKRIGRRTRAGNGAAHRP